MEGLLCFLPQRPCAYPSKLLSDRKHALRDAELRQQGYHQHLDHPTDLPVLELDRLLHCILLRAARVQ